MESSKFSIPYKYIYPLLFIIPLNFFIIGNSIGIGVQWAFFRYQDSYLGSSFIPVTNDIGYILNGVLTGKTVISEILIIIAAIGFIIAFLILLSNYSHAIQISGIITIANGIFLLISTMVQYGPWLHGASGESMPIGVPLILVIGICMVKYNTSVQFLSGDVSLLKKYDYLLLFAGIFLVYYLHTTVTSFSNDTIPNQLLPYYILHDHTLFLDQATTYISHTDYSFRFVDVGNGHYASLFPIVTPILILPFYIIPVTILNIPMTDLSLLTMGKFCAAVISALACIFIFLACKKFVSWKIALATTLIFAFATSTWSISSQALYAHGVVELLLSAALFLMVRNESGESLTNIVLLGIISGLFVFNRPSDAILIIPVVLYVFRFYFEKFKYFLVFAIIAGSPFLIYNLYVFGNPLGGYMPIASRLGFNVTTFINYIGLIAAPNKGLLVFSPVLILAVIGFFLIWNKPENRLYTVLQYFIPVILLNLAIYALFDDWFGGNFYGSRYLTAVLPVLAIGICIALDYLFETGVLRNRKKTLVVTIIAFLFLLSVIIQIIGTIYYPLAVNSGSITSENYNPWSTEHSIIVESFYYGSTNSGYLKPVLANESIFNRVRSTLEPGKRILSEKLSVSVNKMDK
jgi:hypothetical protein